MTITPIVIVEDRGALAVSIPSYLREACAALHVYQLSGRSQVVASGRGLRKWLNNQPSATIRLLLLDYSIFGGTSIALLNEFRDSTTGCWIHPALHPDVLVIGWSAEPDAADAFRDAGAAGFISKHRPIPEIAKDILHIAHRHAEGESWVALWPSMMGRGMD